MTSQHRNTLCALFVALIAAGQASAQTYSTSSNLEAQQATDCIVPFRVSDEGVTREVEWGTDAAWISEENIRRCLTFMGEDNVSIIRLSFQPTSALDDNGGLSEGQMDTIATRIELAELCQPGVQVIINCDPPSIDEWYSGEPAHWAQLIDTTTALYQAAGLNVVSIAPFNEPDYSYTGQGTVEDFYNIAALLRQNPRFDTIRICGGNTLNCDYALTWYNQLKDYLDEGNTHQLAGTFDNYATFYTTVTNDGLHRTADEMHNVMEAMVGLEYGLETGIWWGAAEYARGEFCKAAHGQRLAYTEHRDYWTAASVYRSPEGKIQAFGGMSERQGVTTTYRFLSKERDVFYNGYGPQREYVMELVGGIPGSYQDGQTSGEQVINITWGDDIQPVIDGTYLVVNKNNKKVLMNSSGTPTLEDYEKNTKAQQWQVNPIANDLGGDFSYHQLIPNNNPTLTLDVQDYSMESGADIILYSNGQSTNQEWYLDYAGDGWFRIRSKHSNLCLAASGSSIIQTDYDESKSSQQWRFLPTDVRPRIRSIDAPTNLTAEGRATSILLTWTAADATDPTYTILRCETENGDYETIARDIPDTLFVDNKAEPGTTYYYKVKTVDSSVNSSDPTDPVEATTTGEHDLILYYSFEDDTKDNTVNLNNAAAYNDYYDEGYTGQGLILDGDTTFLQLPTSLANLGDSVTICAWVYWNGGDEGQHIFDFGNGPEEYIYLSPRNESNKLCLGIKTENSEEVELEASRLERKTWIHIAVTISPDSITIYMNGTLSASTTSNGALFSEIKPLLNYIGRSQTTGDPYFYGALDELRIYNYILKEEEIDTLASGNELTAISSTTINNKAEGLSISPQPADQQLRVSINVSNGSERATLSLYNLEGKMIFKKKIKNNNTTVINTTGVRSGLYVLRVECGERTFEEKIIIKH